MTLIVIFYLSGAIIALMLIAKKIEMEHKRTFILLRAISRGDERVRELSHRSAHLYSEGKEKVILLVTKQLPLRAEAFWNKTSAQAQELGQKYIEKIRGAKILHRGDQDISEFFKTLSAKEAGEDLKETLLDEGSQEVEEVVK